MLELLTRAPGKREQINTLKRCALKGSYLQLVDNLTVEFPSLNRGQIETFVALSPAGVLPQTYLISGRDRIFVRTDIFPGIFSEPLVLHGAVEFTYKDDQALCRSLLKEMNLGKCEEGIGFSLSDCPHHSLGLIAELDGASRIGLEEYLHFFQKGLETIAEQFPSALHIQNETTRWLVCEQIRKGLISEVETRLSLAEALFSISL